MNFLQDYLVERINEVDLYVLTTNAKNGHYEKSDNRIDLDSGILFPWGFKDKSPIVEGADIPSIEKNQEGTVGKFLSRKISIGIFIKDSKIYSVALFLEKFTGTETSLEELADTIWKDKGFKYIYMLSEPIVLDKPLGIEFLITQEGEHYKDLARVNTFKMDDSQKEKFLYQDNIDELKAALGSLVYTKDHIRHINNYF